VLADRLVRVPIDNHIAPGLRHDRHLSNDEHRILRVVQGVEREADVGKISRKVRCQLLTLAVASAQGRIS
jgi:hypothetical protein